MTALLTIDGAAHMVERRNGDPLANAFDGLVFGAGNDMPVITDTLDDVNRRDQLPILHVAQGYPVQGDTDPRNPGAGPTVWTWRFEREAGAPFVASNVAVTNYSGGVLVAGAPLLVHAEQPVSLEVGQDFAQRFDERIVVFVNVPETASPTVFFAREAALENRVQRVASWTARARAVQGFPDGSTVDDQTVKTRASAGQYVWTAADVWGINGRDLSPADVVSFKLLCEQWDSAAGRWETVVSRQPCPTDNVSSTRHLYDGRWRQPGGYNVSHTWTPPRGTDEVTFRLTYTLKLSDGDIRTWRNLVEVR